MHEWSQSQAWVWVMFLGITPCSKSHPGHHSSCLTQDFGIFVPTSNWHLLTQSFASVLSLLSLSPLLTSVRDILGFLTLVFHKDTSLCVVAIVCCISRLISRNVGWQCLASPNVDCYPRPSATIAWALRKNVRGHSQLFRTFKITKQYKKLAKLQRFEHASQITKIRGGGQPVGKKKPYFATIVKNYCYMITVQCG